jgi:hypothetical protein
LALERLRQEIQQFQDSLGYQVRTCLKKNKKTGGVAQEVEHLLSK